MANDKDKLLVLDLDETLIYADEGHLDRDPDFVVGPYFVYKRPHLSTFLTYCFENFEVGVWTTSTESYAQEITKEILPASPEAAFLWSRDRCTWIFDEESYDRIQVKKLEKLRRRGYRLESVIVVDDSPNVWRHSYGNVVPVTKFTGQIDDDELELLPRFLEKLRLSHSVRAGEKRNWRTRLNR